MIASTIAQLGRPAVVLMAEDNEDHVLLTQLAFERAHFGVDLRVVADGVECMEFLERRGQYAAAPRPDLLLLDLHMPRMSGAEVMQKILESADPEIRTLAVVVLTTSNDMRDVEILSGLRCNSFLLKPVSFEGFCKVIEDLQNYWFNLVVLPTGKAP